MRTKLFAIALTIITAHGQEKRLRMMETPREAKELEVIRHSLGTLFEYSHFKANGIEYALFRHEELGGGGVIAFQYMLYQRSNDQWMRLVSENIYFAHENLKVGCDDGCVILYAANFGTPDFEERLRIRSQLPDSKDGIPKSSGLQNHDEASRMKVEIIKTESVLKKPPMRVQDPAEVSSILEMQLSKIELSENGVRYCILWRHVADIKERDRVEYFLYRQLNGQWKHMLSHSIRTTNAIAAHLDHGDLVIDCRIVGFGDGGWQERVQINPNAAFGVGR